MFTFLGRQTFSEIHASSSTRRGFVSVCDKHFWIFSRFEQFRFTSFAILVQKDFQLRSCPLAYYSTWREVEVNLKDLPTEFWSVFDRVW